MSFKTEHHLDKDQQIRAIVDEGILSGSISEHLSSCPRCHTDIKKIKQELNKLGQTARQQAPVMNRKITLPIEKPSKIYRWLHDWRISCGAITATAMVLVVVWFSIQNPILHEDSLDIIAQISCEDDDFMAEISALSENVLPQVYLDIIEESYLSVDAEFIKSVMPFIEKEIPVIQSREERS